MSIAWPPPAHADASLSCCVVFLGGGAERLGVPPVQLGAGIAQELLGVSATALPTAACLCCFPAEPLTREGSLADAHVDETGRRQCVDLLRFIGRGRVTAQELLDAAV
jgi:hypothetical protein